MRLRISALLFFILWRTTAGARAQGVDVRGTVLNATRQPVEFATVVLLGAQDSSGVQATVADASGAFVLRGVAPGPYQLRASFVGWLPGTQRLVVAAGAPSAPVQLLLRPAPQQLGEVQVTTLRPRITQLPDRLVMDVASTPLATGYTALEVLARAPGVYVDPRTETVSLNGKGTLVVVDGKRTYLAAADLAVFLKGLPSQELQKIKLVTSPGAKYDAEDPGGVVNIVTKKSLQDGTKGSLTLGAGGTTNSRQSAGLSLNHKRGALALYGGYNLAGRQTRVSDKAQVDYLAGPGADVMATHLLTSATPTRQLAHNVKAGLDWQLGPPSIRRLRARPIPPTSPPSTRATWGSSTPSIRLARSPPTWTTRATSRRAKTGLPTPFTPPRAPCRTGACSCATTCPRASASWLAKWITSGSWAAAPWSWA